jgi:hypothetical protein
VPANPKQEELVTFYVSVANLGGTDAYSFRVETYLDGRIYETKTLTLRAGESSQISSSKPYIAEDGQHAVRWVVNPERSVEESNYGNNEVSCSFFVNPWTVTLTKYATVTKTKTQTEKHTLTMTTTRTLTATRTTDLTVQSTATAKALTVTRTVTGLITSTVYSPTVTTTVTVAQMISNSLSWLALGVFATIGMMVHQANGTGMRRLCRRLAGLLSLSALFSLLAKHHVRKALTAACLVSVIVLSFSSQAGQQAVASTVTLTRTVTVTEWTTLTQSLTSTRYVTATATDTSTFTRRSTQIFTSTPTITRTVDMRSTELIYVPTTATITVRQGEIEIGLRVIGAGPYMKQPYQVEVALANKGSSPVTGLLLVEENQLGLDPNRLVGGEVGQWPLSASVEPAEGYHKEVTIAANGHTTIDGISFTNSWQWIEPVDDVDQFVDLLLTLMSVAVFGLLTPDLFLKFLSLIVEGESFFEALAESGGIAYTDWVNVMDFGISCRFSWSSMTSTKDTQLTVFVPEIKAEALDLAFTTALTKMALAIITSILAALVLGGVTLPLVLELVLAAATGALLGASWALYDAAEDPPSNYLEQTTPIQLPIPKSIQDLPDAPEKTFAVAALRLSSFLNASSTALNQYYSATEAQDLEYMRKNLESARSLVDGAKKELAVMLDNLEVFQDELPTVSAKSVRDAQEVLRDRGLPPELTRLYDEMGIGTYVPTLQKVFTESDPRLADVPLADYLSSVGSQMNRTIKAIDSTLSNIPEEHGLSIEGFPQYLTIVSAVVTALAVLISFELLFRLQRHRRRTQHQTTISPSCSSTSTSYSPSRRVTRGQVQYWNSGAAPLQRRKRGSRGRNR